MCARICRARSCPVHRRERRAQERDLGGSQRLPARDHRTRRHCEGLPQLGQAPFWPRWRCRGRLSIRGLRPRRMYARRSSAWLRGSATRRRYAASVSGEHLSLRRPLDRFGPARTSRIEPVGRAGSSVKTSSREGTQDPAWAFASRENSNAQHEAQRRKAMGLGRGVLLWLLGIPLPIIILLILFWR
jgi:hypothetical protein